MYIHHGKYMCSDILYPILRKKYPDGVLVFLCSSLETFKEGMCYVPIRYKLCKTLINIQDWMQRGKSEDKFPFLILDKSIDPLIFVVQMTKVNV